MFRNIHLRCIQGALLTCILLLYGLTSVFAEKPAPSADDFLKSAERYLREGREFMAIQEFRKAIEKDNKRSEVYGYLSILLYELGFIDDAIEEMRKAVALSPDSVDLNMELGKLYFARDIKGDALEQFISVLEINPGHSNAYYYLGELFLRMKEYDMAWLSAKMAREMGQRGRGLIRRLSELSEEPQVVPWKNPGNKIYIRQMLVKSHEKAETLVNRILDGELFEDIASTGLTGPTEKVGGFLGKFNPSEVHPRIANELLKSDVLSGPYIVQTEKGYHVVQRIMPFNYNTWEELLAEGKGPDREPVNIKKTETGTEDGPFIVFVGSFKKEKTALEGVSDLRELGLPSYHSHRGEWFNVIAGRYNSYSEALKVGKRIASQGYEFFIKSVE